MSLDNQEDKNRESKASMYFQWRIVVTSLLQLITERVTERIREENELSKDEK